MAVRETLIAEIARLFLSDRQLELAVEAEIERLKLGLNHTSQAPANDDRPLTPGEGALSAD